MANIMLSDVVLAMVELLLGKRASGPGRDLDKGGHRVDQVFNEFQLLLLGYCLRGHPRKAISVRYIGVASRKNSDRTSNGGTWRKRA